MGMLTQARVERLMADLSGRVRAETAAIVAGEFASGHLSETDQRIAQDIIAVLARDVEIQVREAVAEHLKSCPFLPRAVALDLAYDLESVALPILQFSYILSEEDLVAIVRVSSEEKQLAVARRTNVRAAVTDALVETGSPIVVSAVLENHTAEISETSFSSVVFQHGQIEEIQRLLIERPVLPVAAIRGLIEQVSDELAARLILKHDIPPALARQILNQGREGAIARLIARSDDPLAELSAETVAKLGDPLTPSLLLRCLCLGNLRFVELGFASLAEISPDSARILMYDPGALGLQSLCEKANLPPVLLRAFRAALAVNLEWSGKQPRPPRAELTLAILDRLVREYREISPGNLEHVLGELGRLAHDEQRSPMECVIH